MDGQVIRHVVCKLLGLIIVIAGTTEGLKCWRCDGKTSNEACHAQFGAMQECNPGDVCQNDFRLTNGEVLIIKGCKQKTACETEVKQNTDKNQCGSTLFGRNMACRCCCETTGCNRKESGCIPPPPPCKRRILRNGRVFCNKKEIIFGTVCKFRCNAGFVLEGIKQATCMEDKKKRGKGFWDPEEMPVCVKQTVRCNPPRTPIPNGGVRCENTKEFQRFEEFNYEGSRCSYFCNENHYIVGKKWTECLVNKKWSNKPPRCQRGSCLNYQPDENRIDNCTERFQFGSSCSFTCKEGYGLVGRQKSDCEQSGRSKSGRWTNGLPRCKEIRCPKVNDPANGKVTCTKGSKLDSVCSYTCNDGYDLDGTVEPSLTSECKYTDDRRESADWTRKPPPTCSRIRCTPPHENPNGGKSSCSNKNWLGSVCRFTCDEGYAFVRGEERVSAMRSVCEDDNDGDKFGEWTEEGQDCIQMVCDLNALNLESAVLGCSNRNRVGSQCTIECEEGFTFGATIDSVTITTECVTSGTSTLTPSWTKAGVPCIPTECNGLEPIPHGSMECSSEAERVPLETSCQFVCDKGYELDGKQQTWCMDLEGDNDENGEWTNPPPMCILIPCPMPVFDVASVMQECVPREEVEEVDFGLDTQCRYLCKQEGHYMVEDFTNQAIRRDAITATCLGSMQWDMSPPRCEVKVCEPELLAITNGYEPRCTNGNIYGSVCTFQCKEKYDLSQPDPLTCIDDNDNDPYGVWDNDIPTCERSHCDDFGRVKHGRLDCTDGTRIGSVCTLTCNERYTPKHFEETECLKTIEWSQRKRFFCCVRCNFNRRIRILAVFDESAFRTRLDWEYMVDFTESYLALLVGSGFDVEFSTFLYGRDVKEKSKLAWKKLYDRENVSAVGEHLEYMCDRSCLREYAGYTGRALRYINSDALANLDDQREHFVIIRTTGRSRDKTRAIAEALRKRNINILTVSIQQKRDLQSPLLDLAGRKRNFLQVKTPSDLKDIPARIIAISRDTGCTDASKSNPCP